MTAQISLYNIKLLYLAKGKKIYQRIFLDSWLEKEKNSLSCLCYFLWCYCHVFMTVNICYGSAIDEVKESVFAVTKMCRNKY